MGNITAGVSAYHCPACAFKHASQALYVRLAGPLLVDYADRAFAVMSIVGREMAYTEHLNIIHAMLLVGAISVIESEERGAELPELRELRHQVVESLLTGQPLEVAKYTRDGVARRLFEDKTFEMSLVLGKLHMEPSEQLAEHAEVTLAGRAYDALLMERMKGNDG